MSKYIVAVLGCTVAAGLCASPASAQQSPQNLPNVEVQQKKKKPAKAKKRPAQAVTAEHERHDAETSISAAPASSTTLAGEAIDGRKPATSDTAQLLSNAPGVTLYSGGAVSSLPAIHGLEDERVRTELNGMLVTSACSNHMNPVLSYADPSAVKKVKVMAGITPVSAGGDSIGGTILVETGGPVFASAPGQTEFHGGFSTFFRGVNNAIGGSAWATAATSNISIGYAGATVEADSYRRGDGGPAVPASQYKAENHALTLAAQDARNLLVVEGRVQDIPYQGFPNVRMDMTGNDAYSINARYQGMFGWGKLYLQGFYHHTSHKMDLLRERWPVEYPDEDWHMLMDTDGQDMGYSVKAEIPLSARDTLRVGNEFHRYLLEDWYPGDTELDFLSVHDGERNRLGTFAEWERKWDTHWSTLFGIRNDTVWMNTGEVHGHNWTRPDWVHDANLFNSQDRYRLDANFDLTALAHYRASATSDFEFGYSRKTRSPNLYERYSWLKYNGMIDWAGDANSYFGNLDLKPEVAHTLSFTAGWHDPARKGWELKVTPYYTFVEDYIGVRQDAYVSFIDMAKLTFVNHDAELYGIDVSGNVALWDSPDMGRFALAGILGYQHGRNLETGDSLYHMMPLNGKLALTHQFGTWSSTAELQLIDAKTEVEKARVEPTTPGYALVNLRTSYQLNNIRFDLGVENLFDELYYSPLGGRNASENLRYLQPRFSPLPGEGRNVYVGMTVKF